MKFMDHFSAVLYRTVACGWGRFTPLDHRKALWKENPPIPNAGGTGNLLSSPANQWDLSLTENIVIVIASLS